MEQKLPTAVKGKFVNVIVMFKKKINNNNLFCICMVEVT